MNRILKMAEDYNADIVKFGFTVEETDKNLKEIRKRHIKSKLIIRENLYKGWRGELASKSVKSKSIY